jgi:hypothetical protein
MVRAFEVTALWVAFGLTVAACSSSGGGAGDSGSGTGGRGDAGAIDGVADGAGACSALVPPGASVSFKDDGVSHCAQIVEVSRTTGGGIDFLEIVGSESSGTGVALAVSVPSPAALGGTYNCTNAGTIVTLFVYTSASGATVSTQSCTITITSAGVAGGTHATGTFSAVLDVGDGGTTGIKNITSGTFDVPISVTGG